MTIGPKPPAEVTIDTSLVASRDDKAMGALGRKTIDAALNDNY